MIAAKEPQEFVPSGRQRAKENPGPIGEAHEHPKSSHLIHDFERVSIGESESSEQWTLRLSPNYFEDTPKHRKQPEPVYYEVRESLPRNRTSDSTAKRRFSWARNSKSQFPNSKSLPISFKPLLEFMEEELYFKDNTVVYSRGMSSSDSKSTKEVICCYSTPFPVKYALWCDFLLERPSLIETHSESPAETIHCVTIIDSQTLRAYSEHGEDFATSLPFQVSRVWATKFGLLFERDLSDFHGHKTETVSEKSPVIFSLAHPLDNFSPVCAKHNGLQVIGDPLLRVVFACAKPALCVAFDGRSGQHHAYKLRRLSSSEAMDVFNKTRADSVSAFSSSSKYKNSHSIWDNRSSILTGAPSPFSTKSSIMSGGQSNFPSTSTSLAVYNNSTPSIGSDLLRNSRLNSLLKSVDTTNNTFAENNQKSEQLNFLPPKLCFEYLWSDSVSGTGDGAYGPATKGFITEDFSSQSFLCYVVPSRNQFCVVNIEVSDDNVTFGMATSIGAKDAVCMSSMRMYAILEHSGNVVLYSGLSVIGKLNIAGVLPQHIPSPYVMRNIRHLHSPFPRRSSLLPTLESPVPNPKFDEHLFSPVVPSGTLPKTIHISCIFTNDVKPQLVGLRDPVSNRITLQYSDETYYRIKLPHVAASGLVENCLNAFRECLPRDILMTTVVRWYTCRNSLGNADLSGEKEWELFSNVVYQLLGYEDSNSNEISSKDPSNTPKRSRHSHLPDDSNWDYLLQSRHHETLSDYLSNNLHLKSSLLSKRKSPKVNVVQLNCNSVLFPYIRIIHFTLHLLYEDLKLNILRSNELKPLAIFLSKVSFDLGLNDYSIFYWKDFPICCKLDYEERRVLNESELKSVISWGCMTTKTVSIFQFLFELLNDLKVTPFPYVRNVNTRTKKVIQLFVNYVKYAKGKSELSFENLINVVGPIGGKIEMIAKPVLLSNLSENNLFQVVEMMVNLGVTNRELETYPIAINLILNDVIWKCRENPPSDWTPECYVLLQRPDLAALSSINKKKDSVDVMPIFQQTEVETDDGMEDTDNTLLKRRFPHDLRVSEVRRLLCSSKPVSIVLTQRPDVSDHDFIEEQERHLYALCSRTMALPFGRGMFTLRMASPVITEPLTTPPLCLTGKAPPRGTTVELSHIDTPTSMNLWPLFHNGVANGLRITPESKNIDSTWIAFNKQKGSSDYEHGGFLLALGLNGHLRNLETCNTFNYLSKVRETITIGMLLGLSAAYRGSCEPQVTRILSIHLEALLPPTLMELDVPHNVQVSALLGIGLLYRGTGHRQMTEVLLNEIGRPPGPEMENCIDRESYSLAAGLGLGLVVLAQGNRPCGLSDLNIEDTLCYYMVGGKRRPVAGPQKEKYKVPSFQIKEGATININITAPGATLALGFMYFGTGNRVVADWMLAPDTQFLLDSIRPDFLVLRTLARSLILWNEIEASGDWVEGHVPASIRSFCMIEPSGVVDVDYEGINQAYCNIVAGACFSLGLKYAGSSDEEVFQILLHYCHMFTKLLGKSLAELAGRPTIECCLNLILISSALVMAGTGNLEIMRIIRHLRRRVGTAASAVVTYGSHLATHAALGLLFLGGGRYTLCNTAPSVASLIVAFYPKFPMHSNDNRYHLQAFRHLYVLAVEPRLFIPRDIMKGKICYANIRVVKLDGKELCLRAPALIPELKSIYRVKIDDERYFPVVFEKGKNWEKLESILSTFNCVNVKQRAGFSSLTDDGFSGKEDNNMLMGDGCDNGCKEGVPWFPSRDSVLALTTDCTVRSFCDYFLGEATGSSSGEAESRLKEEILRMTYEAVARDKLCVLPIFLTLLKVTENLPKSDTNRLWQFKLINSLIVRNGLCVDLISVETMLALKCKVDDYFAGIESKLRPGIESYLSGRIGNHESDFLSNLIPYLVYYDFPFRCSVSESQNPLVKLSQLRTFNLSTEAMIKIKEFL